MKTNLLPDMKEITLSDQAGEQVSLSIEVRHGETGLSVFLSDSSQLGASRLAQNAVYLIDQVCQYLDLDLEETTFYRHIYQEPMGSLFGTYSIDWEAQTYRFQMLTNIDELHNVKTLLDATDKIELADLIDNPKAVNA